MKVQNYLFSVNSIIYVTDVKAEDGATWSFKIGLQGGHTLRIKCATWDYVSANDYWKMSQDLKNDYSSKAKDEIYELYKYVLRMWGQT